VWCLVRSTESVNDALWNTLNTNATFCREIFFFRPLYAYFSWPHSKLQFKWSIVYQWVSLFNSGLYITFLITCLNVFLLKRDKFIVLGLPIFNHNRWNLK
jgi:hypothetical protein